MAKNVQETKVVRILRQDEKRLESVECFNYLGSMITNDEKYTCKIKSRITMEKSSIQQEEDSLH
jgi:hypothetical protein